MTFYKFKNKLLRKFIFCAIVYSSVMKGQVPFPDLHVNNRSIIAGPNTFTNSTGIVSSSDNSVVNITQTAQVEFKAGERVELKNGFHAGGFNGNAFFHAFIQRADFDVVIMEPTATPGNVPKLEKLEMGINLPPDITQQINDYLSGTTGINPYDPEQISIEATFTSNTWTPLTIYGFYYQPFTEDYSAGSKGEFAPVASSYPWRIRFAPPSVGSWTCSIRITSPLFPTLQVSDIHFNCVPSTNKGYLIRGFYGRQLRFSEYNNPSFFAIGQNYAWSYNDYANNAALPNSYPGSKPGSYKQQREAVVDIHRQGGNYVRLVLAPWSMAVEWEKMGDYSNAQARMWELDNLFNVAHASDIYVHLCLELHTQYQYQLDEGGDEIWANNPYNSANQNIISGINTPKDFFTNTQVKAYYKKRLRYIVARWGYSTNLANYELFSEVDKVAGYDNDSTTKYVCNSWQIEMGNYIRNTLNDKRHLITTCYSDDPIPFNIYSDPIIDLASRHLYSTDQNANYEGRFNGLVDNTLVPSNSNSYHVGLSRFDKPYIMGEMGSGNASIEQCTDWEFHNGIWSTAFMDCYGAGLYWGEWDNYEYRKNLNALSGFISAIDFEHDRFQPRKGVGKFPYYMPNAVPKFETFYLVNAARNRVYGWMHNITYYWKAVPCGSITPSVVSSDEKLLLVGLAKRKKYNIEFYTAPHAGSCLWYSTKNEKTTLAGHLKVDVFDEFAHAGEYAYKAYRLGTRDDDDNDEYPSDTLDCPNDSLTFEGGYEDDTIGTKYKYRWDFGNGLHSDLANPTVSYGQPGTYTVMLIVSDTMGFADTLSEELVVLSCDTTQMERKFLVVTSPDGSKESQNGISISPNPNNGIFFLQPKETLSGYLYIYNVFGKVIIQRPIFSQNGERVPVDLGGNAKGIYFIKVMAGEQVYYSGKIIYN